MRPIVLKRIWFAVLVALAMSGWKWASAQQPVNIVITRDQDTLIVYIPSHNGVVSLQGLTFRVVENGQKRNYSLHDYSTFAVIPFDNVPTPICFRVARKDSQSPLFSTCPPNATITHEILGAEVFWYDAVSNLHRVMLITGGGLQQPILCADANVACESRFIPPTFTPTVPTATLNAATLTATFRVPTATPTPLATSTPFLVELTIESMTQSGICIQGGDRIIIEASGHIRVGQWVGTVDPDGTESGAFGAPLGDSYDLERKFPHGALLCRVGSDSDWELCGKQATLIAEENGCLEFEVNDNDSSNNSGAFDVAVQVVQGERVTATMTPSD